MFPTMLPKVAEPSMGQYENVTLYTNIFDKMRPDFAIFWAATEVLQPRTIVEIGCGSGRLLPIWEQSGADSIVGIDLEPSMVKAFQERGDERVRGIVGDASVADTLTEPCDFIAVAASFMKHMPEESRGTTWRALKQLLPSGHLLFDHSPFLYGIDHNTEWRSYYTTFRHWWPEEHRTRLKMLEWRKVISETHDTIQYRNMANGALGECRTFHYSVQELVRDLRDAGLDVERVADRQPKPYHHERMTRFVGLAGPSALGERTQKIRDLVFETCGDLVP